MTIINKEHFTTLYSPARARVMIKKNILAGWAKTGLFPFYLDRVLRDIAKPVAVSPIHTICEDVDYVRKARKSRPSDASVIRGSYVATKSNQTGSL